MNIKVMVDTGNKQETVIYFTMLFSLVIWVIAALGLIVAGILYLFFLWHYIPKADGSLTNYCRRKVETRLERIVGKKIKKAIEKQNQQLKRDEERAIKKGEFDASKSRPTLPKLEGDDDDTSTVFSMQRSDTMNTTATLPQYTVSNAPAYRSNPPSRSNTSNTMNTTNTGRNLMNKPSLPTLDERPGMPERDFTNFSTASYGSNAPMLSQAGGMGRSSPAPPMPPLDRNGTGYFDDQHNLPYQPERSFTPMSQGRASPLPPRGPMPPVDTNYNNYHNYDNGRYENDSQLITPLSNDQRGPPPSHPNRPYQEFSPYDSRGPQMGPEYELSPVDVNPTEDISQHYFADSNVGDNYQPPQLPSALRSGSPAPSQPAGLPSQPRAGTAPPRSGTAPPRAGIPASLQSAIQRREASQPFPNRGMNGSAPPQQQRSATAPIQQPGWAQGPPRSFTPQGPGPQQRSYTPVSGPQQRSYTPTAPRGYDNSYNY